MYTRRDFIKFSIALGGEGLFRPKHGAKSRQFDLLTQNTRIKIKL